MPPALLVDRVSKRFGDLVALRKASLLVEAGERVAVLGPNGAGKTTLARCVCGRLKPDGGSIELLGKRLPPHGGRDDLGFVPQDLALYPDLTPRENLHAFGRFHGLRGRHLKRQVEWALEWTGLQDRATSQVKTFSGGMKRRVNIACGVLHEPKLLLLDEPTVGVDPQSRQRIFDMINQLRNSGTSIMLTTHHLDEAEEHCDRIVIIDHGQVAAAGTLGELVSQTIGQARQVMVTFSRPLDHVNGFAREGMHLNAERTSLKTRIQSVHHELPELLSEVAEMGVEVADVEVHAPSLHAVFLHLTGKELRE